MKISLAKKYILEYVLLICYSFYVFLGHWIWYGRGIQETFLILISLAILSRNIRQHRIRFIRKFQLLNVLIGVVLAAHCLLGIMRAHTRSYLLADLKAMLGTLIISMAVISSVKRFNNDGYDVLRFMFKYMNLYFIMNNLIIIAQYFIPYFLMNRNAVASVQNSLYFDQLTGFLGVNGTTRWDIWSILLLLLNFHIAHKKNSRNLLLYNIGLFLLSCVIAMINSARTFIILAPLSILLYLFIARKVTLNRLIKQVLAILAVAFVAFIIYLTNPEVNDYINHLFTDKLSVYLTFDLDYMVQTNDDRARALAYVLEAGGKYGIGIGAAPMHLSTSAAKYIGQNSTSTYIHLVGIYGYLLWTLLLTRLAIAGVRRNIALKTIVYFAFFLFISYCLPIYSGAALLPAVMLLFYIFSLS